MKTLLVGEVLKYRSFNGANKALPVLASSLANSGFADTVQLDLERPDVDLPLLLAHAADADLIAFAGCMTPQWPELDVTLRLVAEHLERLDRKVPLIVGGYATKSAEDIARKTPWVTAFFDGEGEESIVRIADSVARGAFYQEKRSIPGLCFMNGLGHFHSSVAERVDSLGEVDQNHGFVHVPSIHDMDIFTGAGGRQLKTAQLYTQRGCPWSCGYCNKSKESNAVSRLSEESFRAQLRRLRADGYEAVYLDVDTFTVNQHAAWREAEILAEEGLAWGSNTRIDRIDRDAMLHFARNRCVYMFFGVEHTLPEVSIAIGKFNGSPARQLEQAEAYGAKVAQVFRDIRDAGLPSSYFVILGLPKARLGEGGEILGYEATTFEDDAATLRFGLEVCDPDFLNFNMLRFMPGSTAADTPGETAYSVVRPSKDRPITGGWFLPRVAAEYGYPVTSNHGVYRLCESVGLNQPTTTAVDADRIYRTIRCAMDLINAKVEAGGRPTRMFIDRKIIEQGLVKRTAAGKYSIAPLREFEDLV